MKDWLAANIGKKLKVVLAGAGENLIVIDWDELKEEESDDGETRAQHIFDYFVDDGALEKINSGEWIPMGVLGLTHDPDSFAEMNNGGLLLVDLKGVVFHHHRGNTIRVADNVDALQIEDMEVKKPDVDPSKTHLEEPYLEVWEKTGELIRQGAFSEAIQTLRPLLRELPNNMTIVCQVATLLSKGGDVRSALELLEAAESLKISESRVAVKRGEILMESGDLKQAKEFAEKAMQFAAVTKTKADLTRAHALLGVLCMKSGDETEGLDHLKKAHELSSIISATVSGFGEYSARLK